MPEAARAMHWPLPRRGLGRELTLMLLLKFAAIGLLWFAFFSQPIDEHLDADAVGAALFERGPQSAASTHHEEPR
ncbi:cytochrome oxidase putative small subunit CydP [Plasticicumulans acidivorans]|uniref:DUF4492 domain-containing protein n=1 Tax=Plasticicumulans acidivorans TaxID=886464 RepID=A0A317MT76_9GAMM|nr:cytochrome oxidase putative small subunit CydP [Plasticicumulans acidivorans]PWV60122.1 hypothetical protein C7443_10851 [Plasticicumulans acidivorans]